MFLFNRSFVVFTIIFGRRFMAQASKAERFQGLMKFFTKHRLYTLLFFSCKFIKKCLVENLFSLLRWFYDFAEFWETGFHLNPTEREKRRFPSRRLWTSLNERKRLQTKKRGRTKSLRYAKYFMKSFFRSWEKGSDILKTPTMTSDVAFHAFTKHAAHNFNDGWQTFAMLMEKREKHSIFHQSAAHRVICKRCASQNNFPSTKWKFLAININKRVFSPAAPDH